MIHFLAIQSTYQDVECALFRDAHLVDTARIDKTVASCLLIPTLNLMLAHHGHSLATINFIVANSGPAPFTTLRVVIATVNGIQYASTIPLVGVNGFDALWHEWDDPTIATAIILNAFNNDVYLAFKKAGHANYLSGYGQIENIVKFLAKEAPGPLRFLGNGTAMHYAVLEQFFGDRMVIPADCPSTSSLYHVGLVGLEQWSQGNKTREPLMPLYLKGSSGTLHIAAP